MFFRNVGIRLQKYTVLQFIKAQSNKIFIEFFVFVRGFDIA
jgi:hypothetical protein